MFLSNETPENYFRTNFTLMQYYQWSLYDLENMFPFERSIYIALIRQHQIEQEQAKQAAKQ